MRFVHGSIIACDVYMGQYNWLSLHRKISQVYLESIYGCEGFIDIFSLVVSLPILDQEHAQLHAK